MFAETRLLFGALVIFTGLASAQPANVRAAMVLGSHVEDALSRLDWRCGDEGITSCVAAMTADDGVGLLLAP